MKLRVTITNDDGSDFTGFQYNVKSGMWNALDETLTPKPRLSITTEQLIEFYIKWNIEHDGEQA